MFRPFKSILLATCALSLSIPLGVSIAGGTASAAITAVPCNTNGPAGTADPEALISAISEAASGDTLSLAAGCTYTLSAVNSPGYVYNAAAGANGLPQISQNITIEGNGAVILRSQNADTPHFRIFNIGPSGTTVTLSDLTIDGGSLPAEDGLCTYLGGGIYNDGNLTLTDSTIVDNTACGGGGGIYSSHPLTVMDSTFAGNSSNEGGGIYNEADMIVEGSTFSGNTALNDGGGGAIDNTGQTVMAATIVANSTDPGRDCSGFGGYDSLLDDGYNIADDASCNLTASTSINASSAIDAYLGPLGAYGGPTPTVPLLASSSTAPLLTNSSITGVMPAPPGYTARQLIFDDRFSGTGLDTTKWNTYLGAQGSVWDNDGTLPAPYSGPNAPGRGPTYEMYAPSQVSVDNGLTLTAQRNTNQYSGTYPWLSGVVTTEGKFSLPSTGWYVQARIKVPDMTQGLWPCMWFLPAGSGPFNEIDFVQGGFYGGPANVDDAPVGAGYFDTAGNLVDEAVPDVGFDASAGYHTYGIEWTPGVGIDEYVDGNLVWTISQSQVPGGIVAQAYEIILDLQVAANADAGWRTVTTATSPGGSMDVAEVQAYSLPAPGPDPAVGVLPGSFTLPTGQSACSVPDQRGVARSTPCDIGAFELGEDLPPVDTPEVPVGVLLPIVAIGIMVGSVVYRRRRTLRE